MAVIVGRKVVQINGGKIMQISRVMEKITKNAKNQGSRYSGYVQRQFRLRALWSEFFGSLGGFFQIFLMHGGQSISSGYFEHVFRVLLVFYNELTHYFDLAFLDGERCIVYLYFSYFWGKGFSFWRRNAHVILSLAYFVFIFLIHMQMYCFWGLWSK